MKKLVKVYNIYIIINKNILHIEFFEEIKKKHSTLYSKVWEKNGNYNMKKSCSTILFWN